MSEQLALEPEGEVTPEIDADASPEAPEVVTEPDGQTQQTEGKESEAESSPAAAPESDNEPVRMTRKEQARWDELTRLRHQAERENTYLRQRVAELEEVPPPKTDEELGFDDAKIRAYNAERNAAIAANAAIQAVGRASEEEMAARRHARFVSREAEFAKDNPGYFDMQRIVGNSISPVVADVIKGSEEGPAIVNRLGHSPEIIAELVRLSPIDAAREIGRIERELIYERSNPKPPPISKAPPPAARIAPTDPGVEKDPAKMSDAEFAKWRRKQIAQRS